MAFSEAGKYLLVTCERASRKLIAGPIENKQATTVMTGLTQSFCQLPSPMRRSVTFDNGTEFWLHERLAADCRMKTWFCDPHAPWQKGSVENAIRRLRRYLPRNTPLTSITSEQVQNIINAYNNTPRACLGFRTPAEAFNTSTVALHS